MKKILENYYNNKKIRSIIGKNSDIKAKIYFKDTLKIFGNLKGSINADGLLWIAENSIVTGDINAQTIIIEGTINGNVCANERVELLKTARVYGNIKSKKIKISDGVVFNGKCEIIK